MRGLRKFLTPFAPDQSGAVSVLYELGGIIVIIDAGGCAGNICGFDEPRWSEKRSAVFSAGLRDMDAIMGRDKLLVKKVISAAEKINANFIALIGTPVPAVIGTDYKALKKMLSKETDLPIVTVDTDGMHLFDEGEEKAYLSIVRELREKGLFISDAWRDTNSGTAKPHQNSGTAELDKDLVLAMPDSDSPNMSKDKQKAAENAKKLRAGIFGATPLDLYSDDGKKIIIDALQDEGYDEIIFYGNGASFSDFERAAGNSVNFAVSTSGIRACKLLNEYFGTPYEVRFPGTDRLIENNIDLNENSVSQGSAIKTAKKILIVHSEVFADSIRTSVKKINSNANIIVGSFFKMEDELMEEGDEKLKEEDDFIFLAGQDFDLILGDEILIKMIPDYRGRFINIPEFSISGKKQV